jgi:hypothetical protein
MRRLIPFVLCVLFTCVASATVLVPAEFREIVGGSEIIAYGRVVDVRPEWADGRRWVNTVVTIDVVTYFKGGSDSSIDFTVPGGTLGRYRSVLIGAPVFARGDEAVLFLTTRDTERPRVFGLNQGVFRVRVDSSTGRRLVVPPPLIAKAAADTPERVTRGALGRRPLAVDAFGARVREVMASLKNDAVAQANHDALAARNTEAKGAIKKDLR